MPERSRDRIGPDPTEGVERPILLQSWNVCTWLHWPYDPAAIRPHVPRGLELDTYEGRAWVGLVPFVIENQRPPVVPVLPWISRAQETHIRTYVTAPDGRRGSYFMYLENERLPGVAIGRAGFFLRYVWSRMSLQREDQRVTYRGRRLVPPFARHHIEVEVGEQYRADELGTLDHLVTASWILFTSYVGKLAAVPVEHPPWRLRRARVLRLEEGLFEAAGLPPPEGEPMVHFSEGTDARIAFPRLVQAR